MMNQTPDDPSLIMMADVDRSNALSQDRTQGGARIVPIEKIRRNGHAK